MILQFTSICSKNFVNCYCVVVAKCKLVSFFFFFFCFCMMDRLWGRYFVRRSVGTFCQYFFFFFAFLGPYLQHMEVPRPRG